MRYLILVIATCFPTFGAAEVLEANKRYLCEAETAFGWQPGAKYTEPEVWVSRTKFVVEPAPQTMKQFNADYEIVDREVTHTVKELGKDTQVFCRVAVGSTVQCFFADDDNVLVNSPNFVVNLNDSDDIVFFNHNVWITAWLRMQFSDGKGSRADIAFEGGSCLSF